MFYSLREKSPLLIPKEGKDSPSEDLFISIISTAKLTLELISIEHNKQTTGYS